MNTTLRTIVYAALAVLCIYLVFRYLWPLILILVLFAAAGIWRTRQMVKKTEEEARKQMQEEAGSPSADSLFTKDSTAAGSVIDAEFTEKPAAEKQNSTEEHGS